MKLNVKKALLDILMYPFDKLHIYVCVCVCVCVCVYTYTQVLMVLEKHKCLNMWNHTKIWFAISFVSFV